MVTEETIANAFKLKVEDTICKNCDNFDTEYFIEPCKALKDAGYCSIYGVKNIKDLCSHFWPRGKK